ncbi:DUF72 domain-containing protein [Mucilaginibacter glaciei]|uniref:DUF72 domain-containing protein n=1 Tax=Mucilaginibacter glaciei TaxID=2772109 RepID=A0A926NVJ7_9SPHI|nr:DUF72 domain-containing protein [Mucilaginibacter glaciei]MBD1392578.1 DUF72 domain-containing protein [Mucilaginibacter glaciei]
MAGVNSNKFFSGTSGLVLPVKNKSLYPPAYQDKSRLNYYGSLFNSIEINSSFYRLPQATTVKKWADEVPYDFRFTYKLWKQVTHNKSLLFNPDDVNRFVAAISGAGNKAGSLLIQFPPSTTIDCIRQLEALLIAIQHAGPAQTWSVTVEFRNKSWYHEDAYALLDTYNAGMVIQDLPASITPMTEQPTEFVYLRFHGPDGGYRGTYTDDFLHEYAYYINDWMQDGKTVYAYFNNTMGQAVQNLLTLNGFVGDLTAP